MITRRELLAVLVVGGVRSFSWLGSYGAMEEIGALKSGKFTWLRMDSFDDGQAGRIVKVTTVESRTVSVRINQPIAVVYEFLAAPENWNRWAHGLGKSIRRSGDGWIADSPDGIIKVRFTPRNAFGVVDHYVTRTSGTEVYVPMRVTVNGNGSELLFTLFREAHLSDETYAAGFEYVMQDLNALKSHLEK